LSTDTSKIGREDVRADCKAEDARREAEEGLALLPQAKISGKRDLKQFYTRLLNLPGDSPRPGRAGERPRQTLPALKKKPTPPVAAADKTPVASPEPAPPKPPPVIPPVPVTIEISESDDDPVFRSEGDAGWEQPFLVASISLAKSKRNYPRVAGREYDMVIVDEAHHLKNRNTLNWKLINDLKKRFLLLLTATPVENNLMELYNLITLLKPGQLRTAGEFRNEFMTRGDPTDPQNRTRLRELLGEVMIRNTRSVARIDIPPRFAQTIRVEPGALERELYDRVTALVQGINRTENGGSRLLLKTLLEEAGSSPRAVGTTLMRILDKKDLLVEQAREIRAIGNLCRTLDHSRKNTALLELVRSSPDKVIVFVKYIGTLQYISDFLSWEKISHAVFHGGLTGSQKDENIRRFEGDLPVLIATEVGGEGRNLQFCHRLINYDLPWNPMQIEQRIGRLHRIGQRHEVVILNLCGAGSIEDYILEILDKKINMFEMVIGEIDMILGRTQGDQEFSDLVLDIWVNAGGSDERQLAFAQLAGMVKRLKSGYDKTKVLDGKLFGDNFEL
jgi:hypothetical protein